MPLCQAPRLALRTVSGGIPELILGGRIRQGKVLSLLSLCPSLYLAKRFDRYGCLARRVPGPAFACVNSCYPPVRSLILVDVGLECLSTTTGVRYAALSYVCGSVNMQQTVQKNRAQLYEVGNLSPDSARGKCMTRTIRDRVRLVCLLGIKYL